MRSIERVKCVLLLMMFSLLASNHVQAQEVGAKIDEYTAALTKLGRFSGTVLVAKDGKIILSRGYGLANIEDDVPNTPQTKFRLASITKIFTALAIMKLQEQGKLSLLDSVCKHLTDCTEQWRPITLRHLLNHTSGIVDYTSLPSFWHTISQRLTTKELVASFANQPLQFTTGEKFAYSNSNYILLGQIIEKASGQTYPAFVQESILAPLQMMNSGYDDNRSVIKRRAAGYNKEGETLINARYMDMSSAFSAGGLFSTVEDLLLLDQALYTEKLVSKKSLEEIFTPTQGDVGYGWFIRKDFKRQWMWQSGLNSGFTGVIIRYPEERVFIALLSNFEHVGMYLERTSHDLAAIVFGEKYELPSQPAASKVDTSVYDSYVGTYEFDPTRIIYITKENGKLFARKANGPIVELLPESETTFAMLVSPAKFIFVKDDAGKISHMILRQNGQDMSGKKVK